MMPQAEGKHDAHRHFFMRPTHTCAPAIDEPALCRNRGSCCTGWSGQGPAYWWNTAELFISPWSALVYFQSQRRDLPVSRAPYSSCTQGYFLSLHPFSPSVRSVICVSLCLGQNNFCKFPWGIFIYFNAIIVFLLSFTITAACLEQP